MSIDEVKSTILNIIGQVAPEISPESIDPHAKLQEELDIDSMDLLRIVVAINDELGVEIPEKDYGQVGTLESLVHYVEERV